MNCATGHKAHNISIFKGMKGREEMANVIGVNRDEFSSLMSKLGRLQSEINGNIESLGKTADASSASWQGDAGNMFREKFLDWKTKNLTDFNAIMDEAQVALQKYLTNMEQVDSSFSS